MRENLYSIFGERDPDKRRRAIARIWVPDGLFVDPDGPHRGGEAIERAVEQLLQRTDD
jgi:hypothetical protein